MLASGVNRYFRARGLEVDMWIMPEGSMPTADNPFVRAWVVGETGEFPVFVNASKVIIPLTEKTTKQVLDEIMSCTYHPQKVLIPVRSEFVFGVCMIDCRGYLLVDDGMYLDDKNFPRKGTYE